jgi:hypothetical protein
MSRPRSPYTMQPPVMSVVIEKQMDIMIARNTARRTASLLGFSPADQAQLAGAAATLAELTLKTGEKHELHLNGIRDGVKDGIQLSVATPWLSGAPEGNIMLALRQKVGDLVDEILIETDPAPVIMLMMWQRKDDPNKTS